MIVKSYASELKMRKPHTESHILRNAMHVANYPIIEYFLRMYARECFHLSEVHDVVSYNAIINFVMDE